MYVTRRGFLGFRVLDLRRAISLYDVSFQGFTWNPKFGPNPPSHGLSLAPDRPELWVLDAPNSTVHVFDVSAVPSAAPRQVEDIRLSEPLSGDVSPCTGACERIGSLQHSSSGRYVYVGDAGDVIDTQTREVVTNLEALHNSRVHLEVAWVNGRPVFPNAG
jgi:DNA-binding beta-propeller fold protein YncE